MNKLKQFAVAGVLAVSSGATLATDSKAVVEHYASMAHAIFSDSLTTARGLKKSVDSFLDNPTAATHAAAKDAWLIARVPYGQSEVYRFGNANVDDWEGKVNAWPLDEGLIDYVARSYEYEEGNQFGTYNMVAGQEAISPATISSFHEKGGSEANVATGYHAIEFLLWGQDLNAKPGDSGLRSYTDYVGGSACTNGHCDRRAQYLRTATNLLVADLEEMVADWAPGNEGNYRHELVNGNTTDAMRKMLFGMGSLSLGELAGERINVALLASSQEDEHSCFSDNTHVDIAENARGIRNVYLGEYRRVNGQMMTGASLSDLIAVKNPALDKKLSAALDKSQAAAQAVVDAAAGGEHFDQQIELANKAGRERVRATINALKMQTVDIVEVARTLDIGSLNPETSDSFGG